MVFMRKLGKHNLSNDDYHSDKHYFSSSQLKVALQSPAHFKYHVIDKMGKVKKTDSLDLGTLAHTMLLEPWKFDEEYIIWSGECNKDGKVPAAVINQHKNSHPGKIVISRAHYDFCANARRNVEAYPKANSLFYDTKCEYEQSFFHYCEETKLRFRIRPDILNLEQGYVVDLKTAIEIDRYQFKRAVSYTWDYDLSAYMYLKVLHDMFNVKLDYYWGVVGKEELAPIAIYKMNNDTCEAGKAKFYKAVDNIRTALTMDESYRYQEDIEEM
jgi:hypothetical protein